MSAARPVIRPKRSLILVVALAGIAPAALVGCSYFGAQTRTEEIAKGRILFETHCLGCHGGNILTPARRPPPLYGIFARKYLPSGELATDGQVRATIEDGRAGIMPPFRNVLSHRDIRDIVAYLHTLKPSSDPERGDGVSIF